MRRFTATIRLFVRIFVVRPLVMLLFLIPPSAPPAIRRIIMRQRPLQYLVVVTVYVVLMSATRFLRGPDVWQVVRLGAAFLLGLLLLKLLTWLQRERSAMDTEVIRNEHEHCLSCGYALRHLPPIHRCPECGTPYDMDEVRAAWKEYLRPSENCSDVGDRK